MCIMCFHVYVDCYEDFSQYRLPGLQALGSRSLHSRTSGMWRSERPTSRGAPYLRISPL